MNWPTVIVLSVVLALVVVDIIALRRGKGRCDCGRTQKNGQTRNSCEGCVADCPFKR